MATSNIFDQVIQDVTFGVLPDLQTAVIAIVVLEVMWLGYTLLIGYLSRPVSSGERLGYAVIAHQRREASAVGSFDYDYYNALYKKNLDYAASVDAERPSASDYGYSQPEYIYAPETISDLEMESSSDSDDGMLMTESEPYLSHLHWDFSEDFPGLQMEDDDDD